MNPAHAAPAPFPIVGDCSGGKWQLAIELVPAKTPEIVVTGTSPAIVHGSDYSLVSTSKPAHRGEILVMFASGLGPTRPGVEPGQLFTASPLDVAALPVDVLVNGEPAELTYAGGYPDTTDYCQINFRVPDQTPPGMPAYN